jgi:PadR family transcriptional regulator PadR
MDQVADVRITLATSLVLKALLEAPDEGLYCLRIAKITHLPTGSVFPILGRLHYGGWITDTWETPEQAAKDGRGRPRRYYRLTAPGRRAAIEKTAPVMQNWAERLAGP